MTVPGSHVQRVVRVEAPARLHLGFIDLDGGCGRLFGSVGVALAEPRYIVEATAAAGPTRRGDEAADMCRIGAALTGHIAVPPEVTVRVITRIPRHQGLGSGTQRDLALGAALCGLAGRAADAPTLARVLGRGRRSGIGIAAFAGGGLIVDAGSGPGDAEPPPVVFQGRVPPDWRFVVALPRGTGLHGPPEDRAFEELPAMRESVAGRISRLVLLRVIPGVLRDDLEGFGAAVTEIQRLVGEHFAPVQGGLYASKRGQAVAEFALKQGAAGVGQSSWGPAVFALTRGEEAARALASRIESWAGPEHVSVFHTAADNVGAVIRTPG